MCDPITAMAVISAGSSVLSGVQQNQNMRFQADQAGADADAARDAADLKADKIREKARRAAASFRASMAGSGVSVDSPTTNLINREITRDAELDAIIGINDAGDAASKLRTQASLDRMKGTQAIISGAGKGAGSVITHGYNAGWIK